MDNFERKNNALFNKEKEWQKGGVSITKVIKDRVILGETPGKTGVTTRRNICGG